MRGGRRVAALAAHTAAVDDRTAGGDGRRQLCRRAPARAARRPPGRAGDYRSAVGLYFTPAVARQPPRGLAEMCITAKVLQLGVPLVTAAHVMRVLILLTTTAPIYRLVRRAR
ncbi:MAG TPA: AbrB family transcriptional regulator [Burkholderiales bacterium]|nr:AbrB family transcriptional regulator [Burkholderiales bacterium]